MKAASLQRRLLHDLVVRHQQHHRLPLRARLSQGAKLRKLVEYGLVKGAADIVETCTVSWQRSLHAA